MKIKEKQSAAVVYCCLFSLLVFFGIGGLIHKSFKVSRIQEAAAVVTVKKEKVHTQKSISDEELSAKIKKFLEDYYIDNSTNEIKESYEVDQDVYFDEEGRPYRLVSLGLFDLTGYCPCFQCSEGYDHQTCTGAYATEGRTLAVDPREIAYGTPLWIDGHIGIAEDCGGAINGRHIDVFKEHHEDCFNEDCNGLHEVFEVVYLDAE